jgi:hypothetical protein
MVESIGFYLHISFFYSRIFTVSFQVGRIRHSLSFEFSIIPEIIMHPSASKQEGEGVVRFVREYLRVRAQGE